MHACGGGGGPYSLEEELLLGPLFGRVLKAERLREGLSRMFISFTLMYQNEIYSFNFIRLRVWLAKGSNWISAVSLSRVVSAIYAQVGEEKWKPFTRRCPWFREDRAYWMAANCLASRFSAV